MTAIDQIKKRSQIRPINFEKRCHVIKKFRLLPKNSDVYHSTYSEIDDTRLNTSTGDLEDESGCGACTQLLKGSITQFMTSEKFLEKYPERIEGMFS